MGPRALQEDREQVAQLIDRAVDEVQRAIGADQVQP